MHICSFNRFSSSHFHTSRVTDHISQMKGVCIFQDGKKIGGLQNVDQTTAEEELEELSYTNVNPWASRTKVDWQWRKIYPKKYTISTEQKYKPNR